MKLPIRSKRFSNVQLLTFIAVFAVLGGYILLSSKAAGLNVWVSTTGSDTTCVRGDQTKPCATFDKACSLAQAADIIQIAAGTYSNVADMACAKAVTFQASGTVTVSGTHPSFYMTGNSFTLDGMTAGGLVFPNGFYVRPGAHDITISHFKTLDAYIMDAGNITWRHGEDTGQDNNDGGQIKCSSTTACATSNIMIDDVNFHDVLRDDGTSHVDCLQVSGAWGITVQNSRFTGCATQGLFFQDDVGGSVKNVTVKNNFFGTVPQGSRNLVFGGPVTGPSLVEFNSFQSASVGGGSTSGAVTLVGNIGNISGSCGAFSGATFAYNRWISQTCGATDQSVANEAALNWTNSANLDLHINSLSPAIDFVPSSYCASNPSNCPTTDIDGQARPSGAAYDAGADEYIAATPEANVWVSTTGSDTTCVRGDQTKPCASFNGAYAKAQGGDLIVVACGTYGAQTINSRALGTSVVTIEKNPTDGSCTRPTIGALSINTNYITVKDFNLGNNGIDIEGSSTQTGITVQNNVMAGTNAGLQLGPGGVTAIGNDISGNNNCVGGPEDAIQADGWGNFGDQIPANIILRGNYVHDQAHANGQCGQHADGFQAFGCEHCTIEGNHFEHVDTSFVTIYSTKGSGSAPDIWDIVVQNNIFGTVDEPGHGVSIGSSGIADCGQGALENKPADVIVQNNTFLSGNVADNSCGTGLSPTGIFRNNIVLNQNDCSSNYQAAQIYGFAQFDYNVIAQAGGSCNSTPHAKTCTPSFAGGAASATMINGADLSPADTCAKDYVPAVAGTYPVTDIHSTARPQGTLVDAGADEYTSGSGGATSGPSIGDLNSDGHVDITDLSILLSHFGQPATASQGDCNSDGTVTVADLSILLSHYGI